MHTIEMSRDEAEKLVDLLEDCSDGKAFQWKLDLAEYLRHQFGMVTREEEARFKRETRES